MDHLLEESKGEFGTTTLVPLFVALSKQTAPACRDAAEQYAGRRWARFQSENDIPEATVILLRKTVS
jgi:hypothetical protein